MTRRNAQHWATFEAAYPSMAKARRADLAEYCEMHPSKYQGMLTRATGVMEATWQDMKHEVDLTNPNHQDVYHLAVMEAVMYACLLLEHAPCTIEQADAIAFEVGAPDWSHPRLVDLERTAATDLVNEKEGEIK